MCKNGKQPFLISVSRNCILFWNNPSTILLLYLLNLNKIITDVCFDKVVDVKTVKSLNFVGTKLRRLTTFDMFVDT